MLLESPSFVLGCSLFFLLRELKPGKIMSMRVPDGHSVPPILDSNLGSVVAALHCFWMPVINRGFFDNFLGIFLNCS